MPQISVIVPVYKVESYLCRCVDSILNQTYGDFELILVDDGSPDNCGAICDEYAKKDSRVIVIHQENGGLSAARNAGIDWVFANSNSEWITFVDSDDWVHPEMLEILFCANIEKNTAISICSYENTDGFTPLVQTRNVNVSKWYVKEFYRTHEVNATIACGKLYRRTLYTDKRYPVGKIHEDEFLTYKILFECREVAYVSAPLYFYYSNPSSIVRSAWSPRRLDALEALEERILYFEEKGNADMAAYSRRQLQSRSALLYLQACANRQTKCFPKKYKLHFLKALHILEKICGTDRYEVLLIQDYPHLIKAQAYCRKLFSIMKGALAVPFCKKYDLTLAIVCIAKYEARYIKEWVDYHILQGVDRIYLYDNDSPDGMADVLAPYIQTGKVVYTFFPGKARQLDAYNDAIRRFKHQTKYMAFLDCDEFLVQENSGVSLPDTVEALMRKNIRCGGVAVNWRMYGSSGYVSAPEGTVLSSYLYRGNGLSKGSDCIKTIANPRLIKEYRHVHCPTYYRGFYSINEEGKRTDGPFNVCQDTKYIRINHYFTKSKEEWIERRSRGKADTLDDSDRRTLDEFYEHDHNDIYDPIMLPYVEMLKKMS